MAKTPMLVDKKTIVEMAKACAECESPDCAYNFKGVCRFPLLKERKPNITDEDGCKDYLVDDAGGFFG